MSRFHMTAIGLLCTISLAHSEERPHLVLQAAPQESVSSVAVSHDGRLLVTGSFDGRTRIYDARSGDLLRAIGSDPSRGVNAIAVSPDGTLVAAAGIEMDKTVKLWDVRTGALVKALAGHATADPGNLYAESFGLAFSPDGRLLASAGRDKLVLVWEVASGAVRHRLTGHTDAVASVAFTPDGRTLATGGSDKTVRLWDMDTGAAVRTLGGFAHRVNSIAFSPDGQTLATGSSAWARYILRTPEDECQVKLWNTAKWDVARTITERGRVTALRFSPNGRTLAAGVGTTVRLYDAQSATPQGVAATHAEQATSVAFSPDGATLVSGSHDRTVAVVALPARAERLRLPGYWELVDAVAVSADGRMIASGSGDIRYVSGMSKPGDPALATGRVRLWDAESGRLLRSLGEPGDQFSGVALAPDGRHVAAAGGGSDRAGVVRVWDAKTGAAVWSQTDAKGKLFAVAFAPDGATLATAGADGFVKFRDAATGAVRQALAGHTGAVTAVAYSGDGATVVSGGADLTARVWDARTGRPGAVLRVDVPGLAALVGGARAVFTSVAITRDGGTIATCGCSEAGGFDDRKVRLWDARTGRLLHALERPQSRGRFVAFSPDGAILASNGIGKSIALWDVRAGKFVRELEGHPHPPHAAAFAPDGTALVSGADYRTVKVWDVPGGRLKGTLMTLSEPRDEWLALAPDGGFDGPPGVERLLRWRMGTEVTTADSPGAPRRRADVLRKPSGASR